MNELSFWWFWQASEVKTAKSTSRGHPENGEERGFNLRPSTRDVYSISALSLDGGAGYESTETVKGKRKGDICTWSKYS